MYSIQTTSSVTYLSLRTLCILLFSEPLQGRQPSRLHVRKEEVEEPDPGKLLLEAVVEVTRRQELIGAV